MSRLLQRMLADLRRRNYSPDRIHLLVPDLASIFEMNTHKTGNLELFDKSAIIGKVENEWLVYQSRFHHKDLCSSTFCSDLDVAAMFQQVRL